jgi:hypothetical protein
MNEITSPIELLEIAIKYKEFLIKNSKTKIADCLTFREFWLEFTDWYGEYNNSTDYYKAITETLFEAQNLFALYVEKSND